MKRRFADGGETPALDRLASGEDTGSFDTDVYARAKRFLASQGKSKPAASAAKPAGARLYSPEDVLQMNYKPRRTPPKAAGAGRGYVNRTAKDTAEEAGMRAREAEAAKSRGARRTTDTGDETERMRSRYPSRADEMKNAGDDLDRIQQAGYARGGKVKGYAKGGMTRADGCITKGHTKGKMR